MHPRRQTTESGWLRPVKRRSERQNKGRRHFGKRRNGCLSREVQREMQGDDDSFSGIPPAGLSTFYSSPPRDACDLTGWLS